MYNNYIPQYSTILFRDCFIDVEDFINEYKECPLFKYNDESNYPLTDKEINTVYWLLFSRYSNNPIAQLDIDQFKLRLFSIIYQYGPTWAKRVDIQQTLRSMTEDQLLQGSMSIYNHAYNPDNEPKTEIISFINDQQTTKHKRNLLDAYDYLWQLLKVDVTKEFIDKFNKLFKVFVYPEQPTLYVSEEN